MLEVPVVSCFVCGWTGGGGFKTKPFAGIRFGCERSFHQCSRFRNPGAEIDSASSFGVFGLATGTLKDRTRQSGAASPAILRTDAASGFRAESGLGYACIQHIIYIIYNI